jgi:hypothetical protein
MRAKAHQFKALAIRLAVDRDEIRSDVSVAVIVPFAGQRVIEFRRGSGVSSASKFTAAISNASSFLLCRPDFSRL